MCCRMNGGREMAEHVWRFVDEKRMMVFLCCLCCLGISRAFAHEVFEITGQVHPDLPTLTIRIADTGERLMDQMRENVLSVSVQAQDGSLSQAFTYQSSENPAFEQAAAMAMLRDVNFDGYQDLLLLTGAGARNMFQTLSLWDVEAKQFRPVVQAREWLREEKRFASEGTQAELCNAELFAEDQMLLSHEEDGLRYSKDIFYRWDDSCTLLPIYIWDVYDACDGIIGDALTSLVDGVNVVWDEQYPEEAYYALDGVSDERRMVVREIALGKSVRDH